MRFCLFTCFFLLVSFGVIHSEEGGEPNYPEYIQQFDLEKGPSGCVNDCVNMMTGDYFESHQDLVTSGANPIILSRFFSSKNSRVGDLYDLWGFGVSSSVEVFEDQGVAHVFDRGSFLAFQGNVAGGLLDVSSKFLKQGIVNTLSPYLSGRTHPVNSLLCIEKSRCFMETKGEKLSFEKEDGESNRYWLTDLKTASGCTFKYDHFFGKKTSLYSISAFDREKNKTGEIYFNRREKQWVKAVAEDGREVVYTLKKQRSRHQTDPYEHRYCISKVESNFGPSVEYSYKHRRGGLPELVEKKQLPDQRFLIVDYDKKGRVRGLFAPVGCDAKPERTHRFKYHKNRSNVWDAYNNKKNFKWGKHKRLLAIEEYDEKENLYRNEQFYWSANSSLDRTLLKAKTITDPLGKVLVAKTYQYDFSGNMLEDCLSGNLSGESKVTPKVTKDGKLVSNGCETFKKSYRYNIKNLVIEEDHGDQIVRYDYYPDTDLIRLKTISDRSQIRQRYYYAYDARGAMILEIIDDGCTEDEKNLSGVSERRIQRITRSSLGHPEEIELSFLDLATNEELLIHKKHCDFSPWGHLIREEVYDDQNLFAYAKEWVYDSFGNVIEETDVDGLKTFYTYDANGNCLTKQTAVAIHQVFYDYSNRPIKETLIADGESFSKTHRYDKKGLKVASSDFQGNQTTYSYDAFGRLIKKTLPEMRDIDGNFFNPVEHYKYNRLNQPVFKQDGEGRITKKAFNARGAPTLSEDALGNIQNVVYNLNGTVKATIDSSGTKTLFEYDFLQRKTGEEIFSVEGVFLAKQQWIYNAFHLTQWIDKEGISTHYRYDGAGRKISELREDSEILYGYDSLGRENRKKVLYAPGKYRVACSQYDVKNRLIEERVEDEEGACFSRKEYGYDSAGNRTEEICFTDQGASITKTTYNAHDLPIKVIAPDESVTFYFYRFDFCDDFGKRMFYEQTIDPLGNSVVLLKDAHDRVALEERKNIYDVTSRKAEFIYNTLGKVLERVDQVIVDGVSKRLNKTRFHYDAKGNEIAIFEAYGEPEEKVTRKEYHSNGCLSKLSKPNGVALFYQYDPLKRLRGLISSDETVNLEYCYDHNDQMIQAVDHTTKTTTKRKYEKSGQLAEETLDHGASLKYSYDKMGRLTEFTLPDDSTISYRYNAASLKEIHRKNQVHRYLYGLSGKLARSFLMDGSELQMTYDACLRPIRMTAPLVCHENEYDSCGNSKRVKTEIEGDISLVDYGYDDLYQLTSEKGDATHDYEFDSLGNRLKKNGQLCVVNALNQLTRQGETHYRYDSNGNLIEKKTEEETISYGYDALGRLQEVLTPSGKVSYKYDPLHRRTRKITADGEELYLYQEDKECAAIDKEGKFHSLRVMGLGCGGDIGAAVLFEIAGDSYIPIHNYRGDLLALLDLSGNLVEKYNYTAYGEENPSKKISPWRFSSKRLDPETGFSFFGSRYYDPEIARWITPDPLWFVDGPNLYGYVQNRPTLCIDIEGLFLDSFFESCGKSLWSDVDTRRLLEINTFYDESSKYERISINHSGAQLASADLHSHAMARKDVPSYGPVAISFCNGMANSFNDFLNSYEHLQAIAGDLPLLGLYNSTHGAAFDLCEAVLNSFGMDSKPVHLLRKQWDNYFEYCERKNILPTFIQVCHSQGAILVRNALKGYNPERRKNIHVIAVCPGAYTNPETCGSVVHIIGQDDLVPQLKMLDLIRYYDTVQVVERHPDVSRSDLWDHSFSSPSYQESIKESIRRIYRDHIIRSPQE